jgi:methylenetetrahydrofolate reductase (NADPH)
LKSKWSKKALMPMWGEKIESEKDVWEVFSCYLSGEKNRHGEVVKCLPWNDYEIESEGETSTIQEKLVQLNKKGILTINSQPNANAVPSDNKMLGWGDKNGFVFQKAYLEFFVSRKHERRLIETLAKYPSVNYHIVNHDGSVDETNADAVEPVAVTWGVFPGREICQPTVVDPVSFRVWKDEAFALWLEKWGRLYDGDEDSRNILQGIHDSHLLVNLVDNNFPSENCLWELLEEITRD